MTEQTTTYGQQVAAVKRRIDPGLRDFACLHVSPAENGGWAVIGETNYQSSDVTLAALQSDDALLDWFAAVLGFVDAPEAPRAGDKIIEVSPDRLVAALAPILAVAKAVEDEDPDQELLVDAADAQGQAMSLRCGDLQRLLHEAGLLGMAAAGEAGDDDVPA